MTRLDDLTALRSRIDLEIDRERAYQRRVAALRSTFRAVVTQPAEWPMRCITIAAAHFHVTADDVIGPTRPRDVMDARHVAFWLLRDTGRTLASIGKLTGKDHTTAMNGIRRVQNDPDLLAIAHELRERLTGEAVA